MKHPKGRAQRRHHFCCHKRRARALADTWGREPTPRFCGIHARTPKVCSCRMCGNPRRQALNAMDRLTLLERKALIADLDDS